jgi:hypothetical protein
MHISSRTPDDFSGEWHIMARCNDRLADDTRRRILRRTSQKVDQTLVTGHFPEHAYWQACLIGPFNGCKVEEIERLASLSQWRSQDSAWVEVVHELYRIFITISKLVTKSVTLSLFLRL